MLTVCCVKQGDKYSDDYAVNLYEVVKKHLTIPFTFRCFTDKPVIEVPCEPLPVPELEGWWPKISLFKEGVFEDGEQVLFIDLDTLIIENIDFTGEYKGDFATLTNWNQPKGPASGIMMWKAGKANKIWDLWDNVGRPRVDGGDQKWIWMSYPNMDRLDRIFPDKFVSFKIHCKSGPPKGSAVICFHGKPDPHELGGWVAKSWRSAA